MLFSWGLEKKGTLSDEQREEFVPFYSALPQEKNISEFRLRILSL
jgi:hypothetical protein